MERCVGNRYTLAKKIGSGAFGEIYAGVDLKTRIVCVWTVIDREGRGDQGGAGVVIEPAAGGRIQDNARAEGWRGHSSCSVL